MPCGLVPQLDLKMSPLHPQDSESMFKFYRQKGCQFECRLRYAATIAGCIPWDYPIPKGFEGTASCLSSSGRNGNNTLWYFLKKMDDPNSLNNCDFDCLPDCDEVKYEIQASIKSNKTALPFMPTKLLSGGY